MSSRSPFVLLLSSDCGDFEEEKVIEVYGGVRSKKEYGPELKERHHNFVEERHEERRNESSCRKTMTRTCVPQRTYST